MYARIRGPLVWVVRAGTIKLAVAEHDAVDGEHRALELGHGIRPGARGQLPGDTLRDEFLHFCVLGRLDQIVGALPAYARVAQRPRRQLGSVVRQVGELIQDDVGLENANDTDERDAIEHIADDRLGSRFPQPRCVGRDRVIPATTWPSAMSRGRRSLPITPVAPRGKSACSDDRPGQH